jgi:hypothetical protein
MSSHRLVSSIFKFANLPLRNAADSEDVVCPEADSFELGALEQEENQKPIHIFDDACFLVEKIIKSDGARGWLCNH